MALFTVKTSKKVETSMRLEESILTHSEIDKLDVALANSLNARSLLSGGPLCRFLYPVT